MDEALRNAIRKRANFCCEYCSIPEEATPYLTFHVEHFELIHGEAHGLSAKGRATIKLLSMNAARRVQLRREFSQD